ncbi:hypothetical protein WJX81_003669 [Elliptochloris bilobata]|uniref:Uncharacterized protein n=1 Tax=Elliptochloris bilobata TaxID=381761 RepID=A0AAW1RJ90_9CHLO
MPLFCWMKRELVLLPRRWASSGGQPLQTAKNAVQTRVAGLAKPGALQKVISLHADSFWQHHGWKLIIGAAVIGAYFLWRGLWKLTSTMINFSDTMAETGFLALAAALVILFVLYLRRRYTINPASVYRQAMLQLNTSPAVLEVLGAPVAGSDVRASVMTGGGLRLKGFWPKLRSRRVQMMFPIAGSERRGLASLEAKKQQGRYIFKLLAVDVPTAEGPEQRMYLSGDEAIYSRGGVLRELRDPFLHALALRETHDFEDEADERLEAEDAAQAGRQRAALITAGDRAAHEEHGGAYFHERAYSAARRWLKALSEAAQRQLQAWRAPKVKA